MGGFVRSSWDEVNQLIAAANVYTIKTHGPDRVIGFSPIPAMSMVSYAAGSRYLSLIGGVCMSFYDWYCDLPPGQPADLGRADRRAGERRLVQQHVPDRVGQQRPADPHAGRALLHRGPLQGREDGGRHARLLRSREARRPLDAPEAGHRRRARDGDGPRRAEGVLLQQAFRVLRRLRAPLHRPAAAAAARRDDAGRRHARSWRRAATCAPATSPTSSARTTTPSGSRSPSTPPARSSCPTARSASAGARKAAPTSASGTSRPRKAAANADVKLKLSVLEDEPAARGRRGRVPLLRRRQRRRTSRTTRSRAN